MDEQSRNLVRKSTNHMVSWLHEQGIYPSFGAELEYWLFQNGHKVGRNSHEIHRFQERVGELARVHGIRLATQTYDAGVGQYELSTAVTDPEKAGEWSLELKKILKQAAQEQGLTVDLKPKPSPDLYGSGFHVHMGIYDRDISNASQAIDYSTRRVNVTPPRESNLLLDRNGQRNGFAKAMENGLCEVMEESQIFYFPSYNALKRNFGAQGSSYASKLLQASTTKGQYALRIIDAGGATRYEARLAGMDADPDLVMASLVAGIVRGAERGRNLHYTSPLPAEPPVQPDTHRSERVSETQPPARRGFFSLFRRRQQPEESSVTSVTSAARSPIRRRHLPTVVPSNTTVPTSIPLAGGLQVYQEDVPAKDYLSYCFMNADQLPRLLGAATYERLAGGLMKNSSFFISPVNLEEYNLKGGLLSSTSWDIIQKILGEQHRQIATQFVKVSGDKELKRLIFAFSNEDERNRFVKQEMGPYLLEALSEEGTPFHGAMTADGSYKLGKKPNTAEGEMPCLVLDASKAAGYLEIWGKTHKSTQLRTELQRFQSRKQSYTGWVPIHYEEIAPEAARKAKLIIDGAEIQLEQRQSSRPSAQATGRSPAIPTPTPAPSRAPVLYAEATHGPAEAATDESFIREVVRHHNWRRDANRNYRITRNELNLANIGRMQNQGVVLTDNYVFVLSGSELHTRLTEAIQQRTEQEAQTQRLAEEQGRIDPSAIVSLYQELATMPAWQRDRQGRYFRPLSDFTETQVNNMRRINGDIIVSDQFAFVSQNTELDRAISENFRSQIEYLARNIDNVLPRAVSEVQWQRDPQTNAWVTPSVSVPQDILQTLLADGNNVVQQEDGRLFVSEGSDLENRINEHGVDERQRDQILENALRHTDWKKDRNHNFRIPREALPEVSQNILKNAGAILSSEYVFVRPQQEELHSRIKRHIEQSISEGIEARRQEIEALKPTTQQKQEVLERLPKHGKWTRMRNGVYYQNRSAFNDMELNVIRHAVKSSVVSDNYVFISERDDLAPAIASQIRHEAGNFPVSGNARIARHETNIRAMEARTLEEYIVNRFDWRQDYPGWRLDNYNFSNDTSRLLEAYATQYPEKLQYSVFNSHAAGDLAEKIAEVKNLEIELQAQRSVNSQESKRKRSIEVGEERAHNAGYRSLSEYIVQMNGWRRNGEGWSIDSSHISDDSRKILVAFSLQHPRLLQDNAFSFFSDGALSEAIAEAQAAEKELWTQTQRNRAQDKTQQIIQTGEQIARTAGHSSMEAYVARLNSWRRYGDHWRTDLTHLSGDSKKVLTALQTQRPELLTGDVFAIYAAGSLSEMITQLHSADQDLQSRHRQHRENAKRDRIIATGEQIAQQAGCASLEEYVAILQGWRAEEDHWSLNSSNLNDNSRKVIMALEQQHPELLISGPWCYYSQGRLSTAIHDARQANRELNEQRQRQREEQQRQRSINTGIAIAQAAGCTDLISYAATKFRWREDNGQFFMDGNGIGENGKKVLNGIMALDSELMREHWSYYYAQGTLADAIRQIRQNPPNASNVRGRPQIEQGPRQPDQQELE